MAPMKILPFSVLVWSCLFIYVCNGRDESKRFILDTLFHWGQWGDYTQCTDCIKGSKSRQRYCYDGYNKQIHGTNCGGYAIEFLPCSQSECGNTACVDTFSPCLRSYCTDFTDWSQINCKKTCGFCTVVSSVNGNWGPWSRFTACSHSCGTGTTTRNRYCNNPAPSGNGYGCYGNGYETKTCNTVACSVDGGWSRWDPWSSCTTSCGLGVIARDRTCTNPSPVGNGAPCSGDHTEKHCAALDLAQNGLTGLKVTVRCRVVTEQWNGCVTAVQAGIQTVWVNRMRWFPVVMWNAFENKISCDGYVYKPTNYLNGLYISPP